LVTDECIYRWISDGSDLDYTNWRPGQPDNCLNNPVVQMPRNQGYQWDDTQDVGGVWALCQTTL
jgi:hypothetical protein